VGTLILIPSEKNKRKTEQARFRDGETASLGFFVFLLDMLNRKEKKKEDYFLAIRLGLFSAIVIL
jgi:hypothetical protein